MDNRKETQFIWAGREPTLTMAKGLTLERIDENCAIYEAGYNFAAEKHEQE